MKVVDFVKKNYIFRSRVGERGLYMKRSGFVGWIGGSILLLAGYYPSVSHLLSNISTQCDDVTSYVVASDNVDAAKIAAMSSLFSLENAGNSEFSKQMMAYSLSQDQAGSDSKLATVARRKSENAVKTIKNGEFANCRYAKGSVRTNFYADAIRAGLPPKVIDSVKARLGGKINFRRALKKGDTFEVVFDQKNNLVYASLCAQKRKIAVYAYKHNGKTDYFYDDGSRVASNSSASAFGRPLNGKMTVSSHFGMRHHPVTGERRMHSGVDYIARHGEPVFAISDGVVTRACYYGAYGKCVDVKHASGYTSRYAHLSNYCVRPGQYIKKGARLGSVGATGVTTGTHLHLEVARNNRAMNPLSVKMIPAEVETVGNMASFKAYKNRLQKAIARG